MIQLRLQVCEHRKKCSHRLLSFAVMLDNETEKYH